MYVIFLVAPAVFGAAAAASYRWRIPRPALVGIGLTVVSVIGVWAVWQLRDASFNAMGGNCQEPKTRFFMELMVYTVMLLSAISTAGAGLISGRVMKWNRTAGFVLSVFLLLVSAALGFFAILAAGMTSVDGYRC